MTARRPPAKTDGRYELKNTPPQLRVHEQVPRGSSSQRRFFFPKYSITAGLILAWWSSGGGPRP